MGTLLSQKVVHRRIVFNWLRILQLPLTSCSL